VMVFVVRVSVVYLLLWCGEGFLQVVFAYIVP